MFIFEKISLKKNGGKNNFLKWEIITIWLNLHITLPKKTGEPRDKCCGHNGRPKWLNSVRTWKLCIICHNIASVHFHVRLVLAVQRWRFFLLKTENFVWLRMVEALAYVHRSIIAPIPILLFYLGAKLATVCKLRFPNLVLFLRCPTLL